LQDEHIERLIDEALEETFPASDPPSAGDRAPAWQRRRKMPEGKDISKRW